MSTIPYKRRTPTQEEYPIVKFARLIGKNTAEFTSKDMRKFLRWLWKQPVTERVRQKYFESTSPTPSP